MKNTKQSFGDLGQHWTPEDIVGLMVKMMQNRGRVLEPSAGSGRFMRALPNAVGVELDPSVIPSDLQARYTVMSFFDYPETERFDSVIGNPPYVNGKLLSPSWFGSWTPSLPITANAYLHFIDKCINHLSPGGELIFIVPSSLLSETSKGARLRSRMCAEGAFTDFIFAEEIVKWDKAAVNTIIFRWVKGQKQGMVATNRGQRRLVEAEGFAWLVDFSPAGSIGDYFKATVGAAPSAAALDSAPTSERAHPYIRFGEEVMVDETNFNTWPRPRHTPRGDKIFFIGGPTRKATKFFFGTSERHMDHALIPKKPINCRKAAGILNEWFNRRGHDLGLIIGGRWNVGVKQFEHCPIDVDLVAKLNALLA